MACVHNQIPALLAALCLGVGAVLSDSPSWQPPGDRRS